MILIVGILFLLNFISDNNSADVVDETKEDTIESATPEKEIVLQPIPVPTVIEPIVREIEKKIAFIENYSCVIKTTKKGDDWESIYMEERIFEKPNLFYSNLYQAVNPVKDIEGQFIKSFSDGKSMYRRTMNPPGTGKKMLEKIDPKVHLTQAERKKIKDKYDAPKIQYYDLEKIREAGYKADEIILQAGKLLFPFMFCSLHTLRLERENNTNWVFTAVPESYLKNVNLIRLSIRKDTGLLETVEMIGEVHTIEEISDIQVNREIHDSIFKYSPPDDLKVVDETEITIQSFNQMSR